MANQLEIKREQYIRACALKAEIEAELRWAEAFGSAVETPSTDEMLDRRQAADLLGRGVTWIREREEEGILPRVPNLGPKTVRYWRADIERLRGKLKE